MAGSHNSKRISKPIPDTGKFPIEEPKSKWNKSGEEKAKKMSKFKKDFQSQSSNNRPRTIAEGDTYEAKYSKTGSLLERKNRGFDVDSDNKDQSFDDFLTSFSDRVKKENKLNEAIQRRKNRGRRLQEADLDLSDGYGELSEDEIDFNNVYDDSELFYSHSGDSDIEDDIDDTILDDGVFEGIVDENGTDELLFQKYNDDEFEDDFDDDYNEEDYIDDFEDETMDEDDFDDYE